MVRPQVSVPLSIAPCSLCASLATDALLWEGNLAHIALPRRGIPEPRLWSCAQIGFSIQTITTMKQAHIDAFAFN